MANTTTPQQPQEHVFTHPAFFRVSVTCVVLFAVAFVASLFMPAIDIGSLVDGEDSKNIIYGVFCLVFMAFSPLGWIQHFLIMSTALLARRHNGLMLFRSVVVSGFWLWVLSYWSSYSRDLYAGFYFWVTAISIATGAHWLTYIGNTSCFGFKRLALPHGAG